MSIASPNPASFFAGQWSQIKDALIAAAGDSYGIAGQNGGKKTLETKNVPQHKHNIEASNSNASSTYGWVGFWDSNAAGGSQWKMASYGSSGQTSIWAYATSLTGGGIKQHTTLRSLQLRCERLASQLLSLAKEVSAKWLR